MPKKKSVKKTTKKKIAPTTNKNPSSSNAEKILIENTINLQKVLANLSLEIKNMNKQISSLLEMFEQSAKAITEKEIIELEKPKKSDSKDLKQLEERLDKLLDQNKTIARGLTMLHERELEKNEMLSKPKELSMPTPSKPPMPSQEKPKEMDIPAPSPTSMQQSPVKPQNFNPNEYQKSIASENPVPPKPQQTNQQNIQQKYAQKFNKLPRI